MKETDALDAIYDHASEIASRCATMWNDDVEQCENAEEREAVALAHFFGAQKYTEHVRSKMIAYGVPWADDAESLSQVREAVRVIVEKENRRALIRNAEGER